MNPEELRIGNLVSFRDKTVEVQALSKLHIKIWCEEKIRIRWVSMRDVQAIELTEEKLVWLGFQEETFDDDIEGWSLKGFSFINPGQIRTKYGALLLDKEIHSVHQIQNMYFCLMGDDIKINCPIV